MYDEGILLNIYKSFSSIVNKAKLVIFSQVESFAILQNNTMRRLSRDLI